ncbi:MAG: hypothetical protein M3Q99_02225 [Acidobacteriota bacterium]|nr:hypothetical protein [Acidobacteriota bacterium]
MCKNCRGDPLWSPDVRIYGDDGRGQAVALTKNLSGRPQGIVPNMNKSDENSDELYTRKNSLRLPGFDY